jgi:hypothetical protein
VPNEIIYNTLYWFKYLEGDAALSPVTMQEGATLQTYRNRYARARFAITARRVHRLWRDIADLTMRMLKSPKWQNLYRMRKVVIRTHIRAGDAPSRRLVENPIRGTSFLL